MSPNFIAGDVLDWILIISVVCAIILFSVSMATLGRQISDLEYQVAVNINGIRRLQSWINIRIQACYIFMAFVFITTSLLGLAGASLEVRLWVNRSLYLVLLGLFMFNTILAWMAEQRQVQLLIGESGKPIVPEIRAKGHILMGKMQVVASLVDSGVSGDELTESLNEVITEVKSLQGLLRKLDPTYKIEVTTP